MDTNNNPNINNRPYRRSSTNSMATASIVMGIIGIFTLRYGATAIMFGALGIIFFLLSDYKTVEPGLRKYLGRIICIIALVLGIVITIKAFLSLPAMLNDPVLRRELDDVFQQMYGMDFQTFYDTYMRY